MVCYVNVNNSHGLHLCYCYRICGQEAQLYQGANCSLPALYSHHSMGQGGSKITLQAIFWQSASMQVVDTAITPAAAASTPDGIDQGPACWANKA